MKLIVHLVGINDNNKGMYDDDVEVQKSDERPKSLEKLMEG